MLMSKVLLQIDFSLLLDVRIVLHSGEVNEVYGRDQDTVTNLRDNNKHEKAHAPSQGQFMLHVRLFFGC